MARILERSRTGVAYAEHPPDEKTGAGGLKPQARRSSSSPQEVFAPIYALLFSSGYRTRYADFLKVDFPRVLLPVSPTLFTELGRLGRDLIGLHTLRTPQVSDVLAVPVGQDSPEVRAVAWSGETIWLDSSPKKGQTVPGTTGFGGVPQAVWGFHIGGYQVCEKWLKDRKGRTLSKD